MSDGLGLTPLKGAADGMLDNCIQLAFCQTLTPLGQHLAF